MTTKNEPQPTTIQTFAWPQTLREAKRYLLIALSYCIITFGQPAYSTLCSLLTATVGYALFFTQIVDLRPKLRGIAGFFFFFSVQLVQLFWFTYHPVKAVWGAYLLLSFLMGLQFAFLSLFVSRKTVASALGILLLASIWTLLEWSRIYWCSGFYFDLTGISMSSNLLSLQTASIFGVLGMSFWVLVTNGFIARCILFPKKGTFALALLVALLPYLFGAWHLSYHEKEQSIYDTEHPPMRVLIVHSKNVPDVFKKRPHKFFTAPERALESWREMLEAIAPFYGQQFDLVLMPEGVIPYGSTSLLFTSQEIQTLFGSQFNATSAHIQDPELCSEDVAQAISSLYNSPLIIGLEGIERPHYFNSAFFFLPGSTTRPLRYDKQVLVPMGEYIPLDFAKQIAAKYGVFDSFTPGTKASLFDTGKHKIGSSICYEETVGSLMRQNSELGATLLVNLTDDYWFPYSTLPRQHFEHARPRTVENGIPLIRSCNYGISGAIDSLGRTIVAKTGPYEPSAFIITLSSYHYSTIYGRFGDYPIILISICVILATLLTVGIREFSRSAITFKHSKSHR